MGAAVFFVAFAFHEPGFIHPVKQGSHGVWVAAHAMGEFALGDAAGITFQKRAHHRELIRRDLKMRDAAAKSLV